MNDSLKLDIKLHNITIWDLVKWYINSDEEWVVWYDWKLDIRPAYQREFVYKEKERNAVIDTVMKWYPLNVMYWAVNDDWTYEVLDGQQRTISICEYAEWNFSILIDWNPKWFNWLTPDQKKHFLEYPLMVYFCKWKDEDKLSRFETVNIAWAKLTQQELRNSVYTWPWLSDAKRHFSKTNCVAKKKWEAYITWDPIRQELLEKTLKWICEYQWIKEENWKNIEKYMSIHQFDNNADELWQYYQDIVDWIEKIFIGKRKEMKWLDWGKFYNKYKDQKYNAQDLEGIISNLMKDSEVQDKKWIYEYVLSWDEKHLNLRWFDDNQKAEAYEKCWGICAICGEHFERDEMHADHKIPWSKWWKTVIENCQMLCRDCNLEKWAKY